MSPIDAKADTSPQRWRDEDVRNKRGIEPLTGAPD
jgi:hypothetical protein